MTDTDVDDLTGEALDAEDYLLDSMGDAITLWEALRHPMTGANFARFESLRASDPWAARESVAQLVEYFQQTTGALDAPADTLAELFLIHCTNASEPPSPDEESDEAFLECVIPFALLPQAGEQLEALDLAGDASRPAIEAKLVSMRNRRDA